MTMWDIFVGSRSIEESNRTRRPKRVAKCCTNISSKNPLYPLDEELYRKYQSILTKYSSAKDKRKFRVVTGRRNSKSISERDEVDQESKEEEEEEEEVKGDAGQDTVVTNQGQHFNHKSMASFKMNKICLTCLLTVP